MGVAVACTGRTARGGRNPLGICLEAGLEPGPAGGGPGIGPGGEIRKAAGPGAVAARGGHELQGVAGDRRGDQAEAAAGGGWVCGRGTCCPLGLWPGRSAWHRWRSPVGAPFVGGRHADAAYAVRMAWRRSSPVAVTLNRGHEGRSFFCWGVSCTVACLGGGMPVMGCRRARCAGGARQRPGARGRDGPAGMAACGGPGRCAALGLPVPLCGPGLRQVVQERFAHRCLLGGVARFGQALTGVRGTWPRLCVRFGLGGSGRTSGRMSPVRCRRCGPSR
jgi:hypothetical protein